MKTMNIETGQLTPEVSDVKCTFPEMTYVMDKHDQISAENKTKQVILDSA